MKKIFTLLLICVLLITTCTGCQLALPEEATAGDELIGMYVTTEDMISSTRTTTGIPYISALTTSFANK